MGRLRIKKKESVIPFRQTLAYRLLLLTPSIVVFLIATYQMMTALYVGNLQGSTTWGVVLAIAAVSSFYNIDRVRHVRVPPRTMKRMGRR